MGAAIIPALLGALGVGAQAYGASQAGNAGGGGVDLNDVNSLVQSRPLGNESVLGYLSAQQLYELGVPIQGIEDELLMRSISNNKTPQAARKVMSKINTIRTLLASGDAKDRVKAQKLIDKVNKPYHYYKEGSGETSLDKAAVAGLGGAGFELAGGGVISGGSGHIGKAGGAGQRGGFQLSIDDSGQLQVEFSGAEGQVVDELRTRQGQQQQNLQNRLNAFDEINRGLGGIKVPTQGDISAEEANQSSYLNRQLDEQLGPARDRITTAANQQGYSPAARLAELDRLELNKRQDITDNDALQRALQLITGRTSAQAGALSALKGGLSPTLGNSLQGAADTSSQNSLAALQLGLNLGITNAQAQASSNVSQLNAINNLGSNALQGALGLYSIGQLSSGNGGGYNARLNPNAPGSIYDPSSIGIPNV